MTKNINTDKQLADLKQQISTLQQHCAWLQQQNQASLCPYIIEEAHETVYAIQHGTAEQAKDELADLLYQILLQSELYQQQHAFDFADVIQALQQKLQQRNPHILATAKIEKLSLEQTQHIWQQQKQQAQPQQGFVSRLAQVKHGASLSQAEQLQRYAAQLNFDWENVDGAWQKLQEELAELQQAIQDGDTAQMQAELGDCLFSMVNVGRKLSLSSEMAIQATNHKFRQRFGYIEQQLAQQNQAIETATLEQLDELWNQAKMLEKDEKKT
ncbi:MULTISPECIES: nucleoside triphosphate pyrophosphohydrolase [unclassified Acinetobacter]|uniref:nucleoside triphosphate pyrophosphohydrolase n=1 Tax=unclassified Acinetobacter TaxID=196816 RepID=UPI0035B92571